MSENFHFETYLEVVKDYRYRHALTKFRTSSHTLEIERGRYTKTDVNDRLCISCKKVDDERHFILDCCVISAERQCLFEKIHACFPNFVDIDDLQKFKFLLMSEDPQILTWLAKFIYTGFNQKDTIS